MLKLREHHSKQWKSVSYSAACFLLLFCSLFVSTIGCGDDGVESVTGTVTYNGKPVTKGNVRFIPESGRPASGAIDSNGRYEMATSKDVMGIAPGEYTVTVRVAETSVSGDDYANPAAEPSTTWIVPEKYADHETTPLTATVSSSGSNVIDFDIPAE